MFTSPASQTTTGSTCSLVLRHKLLQLSTCSLVLHHKLLQDQHAHQSCITNCYRINKFTSPAPQTTTGSTCSLVLHHKMLQDQHVHQSCITNYYMINMFTSHASQTATESTCSLVLYHKLLQVSTCSLVLHHKLLHDQHVHQSCITNYYRINKFTSHASQTTT